MSLSTNISFTLTNLALFISFMSPFLVVFFILMYSIITSQVVKGLIYISGILIVTYLNYILKNTLKSKQDENASPFCNILPTPFTVKDTNTIFNSPSLNSTLIGFTSGLIIFPMFANNEYNAGLLTFFIVLLLINGVVELHGLCTGVSGVLLGSIIGIILGILYYLLIYYSGNKDLAYFTQLSSNNTQCSKPSKQKFRCTAYVKDSNGKYNQLTQSSNTSYPYLDAATLTKDIQISNKLI